MSHLGNLISALIDGELDGVELDRANGHLAGCASCQAEAAQLRALKRELRALGQFDGADAMTGRLLAMAGPDGPGGRAGASVAARPLRRTTRGGRPVRRRRGRYAMWSAMSLVVVGVSAAAFGMGGTSSSGNEPQITPQQEVVDLQHTMTGSDVLVAEAAGTRAPGEAQTTANAPVKALLLRLAAEETRP